MIESQERKHPHLRSAAQILLIGSLSITGVKAGNVYNDEIQYEKLQNAVPAEQIDIAIDLQEQHLENDAKQALVFGIISTISGIGLLVINRRGK